MIYLVLSVIIVICLFIIIRLAKSKIPGMKTRAVERKVNKKERQAEIKNRLLENKLKKQLVGGLRSCHSFWFILKKIFNRITVKIKEINRGAKSLKTSSIKINLGSPQLQTDLSTKIAAAEKLIKAGRIDEAEDKLIEILKIDHKNIAAYMALGEIYVLREDWATAEEAYRYIVKLKPKFIAGHKELCHVYKSAKKWVDLRRICDELLAMKIEEAWVYINLGFSYARSGYPEKAEEYYQQAVAIEPQNEAYLDYLIDVAIINKNKSLAEKVFNTIAGLSKDQSKLQTYRNKLDII